MGATTSCCTNRLSDEDGCATPRNVRRQFPPPVMPVLQRDSGYARTSDDAMQTAIQERMEELQSQMHNLRTENSELHQTNGSLTARNRQLRRVLEDKDLHAVGTEESYTAFDIVEHHYKQLERHNSRMRGETRSFDDADSAAGHPSRPLSPRGGCETPPLLHMGSRNSVWESAAGSPCQVLHLPLMDCDSCSNSGGSLASSRSGGSLPGVLEGGKTSRPASPRSAGGPLLEAMQRLSELDAKQQE